MFLLLLVVQSTVGIQLPENCDNQIANSCLVGKYLVLQMVCKVTPLGGHLNIGPKLSRCWAPGIRMMTES